MFVYAAMKLFEYFDSLFAILPLRFLRNFWKVQTKNKFREMFFSHIVAKYRLPPTIFSVLSFICFAASPVR